MPGLEGGAACRQGHRGQEGEDGGARGPQGQEEGDKEQVSRQKQISSEEGHQEVSWEGAEEEDFAKEDFAKEDFAKEDFAKEDFAKEDFAKEDFAKWLAEKEFGEEREELDMSTRRLSGEVASLRR